MAERTFVALDLETTGLDPQRDAIIEVGAVRFRADGMLDHFSTLVNPQRPISLRIQQLTGIHSRDVAHAPALEHVLPELLGFVEANTDALVAHNAAFDLGFLKEAGVHFHRPALDTHELATILLPGMASYNLGELCRALHIEHLHAHRAVHDAEATALLFCHLWERIAVLPRWTLEMLVESGADGNWPPLLLFRDALRGRPAGPPPPPAGQRPQIDGAASPHPALSPPTATRQEIPETLLADCLAPDGPLARLLGDEYEERDGQVAMARLVLQALNHGDHRIIEAGTGTGKSLAYLLPAALWSAANGQRVVIATNTIPLQDQLLQQEIPRVQALLTDLGSAGVRVKLLKGRAHYLCTHRLDAWRRGRRLSSGELRLLAKVLVWLPGTRTGDVSELSIHEAKERAAWAQIASDPSVCSPEWCDAPIPPEGTRRTSLYSHTDHYRDYFLSAYQEAQAAHLLIVNHALLLADLHTGGRVLPEYDHLIIDEAHHLEAAATEQLTYRANRERVEALLASLAPPAGILDRLSAHPGWRRQARQIEADRRRFLPQLHDFLDTLLRFVLRREEIRPQRSYPQRLALDNGVRAQPAWSQIEIRWDAISGELAALLRRGTAFAEALEAARWWQQDPESSYLRRLRHTLEALNELLDHVNDVVFQPISSHQSRVAWLELSAHADTITLCTAPLQVSELLSTALMQPRRTVILTGATLRTGDGFAFLRERLGCWEARATVIDSPFDYRRNVLLYLPGDMPTPDRPHYQNALEQAIIQAALAAGGRTLVLFTSYAHLRATAGAIRAALAQHDIALLEHGTSGRHRLLREFRANPKAVLLGTRSFWEGIDLPGDQLSCLLMARLPFAVPTDPLYAARSHLYDDPFHEYALPDAVLRFRQGFGRLIRRAHDRGVVVLLDSRVWRREYGEAFLEALPVCTVRRAPLANLGETAAQWLSPEGWPLSQAVYAPPAF